MPTNGVANSEGRGRIPDTLLSLPRPHWHMLRVPGSTLLQALLAGWPSVAKFSQVAIKIMMCKSLLPALEGMFLISDHEVKTGEELEGLREGNPIEGGWLAGL